MINDLPSLEHFSRDELVQLVAILHGALRKADESYSDLAHTTQTAVDVARASIDWSGTL